MSGTGNKNNKICPVNRKTRLDPEGCWIETLQTSFPYGLNESKREVDPNVPVAYSFLPTPRSRQRYRDNANFDKLKDMKSIFNCIHNYIAYDIKKCILSYTNIFEQH